jgi:hypothetical protein
VWLNTHLQNTLLVSAKGVFCQGVKNEPRAVRQGPHALRMFYNFLDDAKRSVGYLDLVAKGFSVVN